LGVFEIIYSVTYIFIHIFKQQETFYFSIQTLIHLLSMTGCLLLFIYSVFDLINIHLFHDASNIIAMQKVGQSFH